MNGNQRETNTIEDSSPSNAIYFNWTSMPMRVRPPKYIADIFDVYLWIIIID